MKRLWVTFLSSLFIFSTASAHSSQSHSNPVTPPSECETVVANTPYPSLELGDLPELPREMASSLGPLILVKVNTITKRSYLYDVKFASGIPAGNFVLKLIAKRSPDTEIETYDRMKSETRRGYQTVAASSVDSRLVFNAQAVTINGVLGYLSPRAEATLRTQLNLLSFRPWASRNDSIALVYRALTDVLKDLAIWAGGGIAHNDVRAENIFLYKEHYHLADFDTATRAGAGETTISYSPLTISPEELKNSPTDALSDAYGLGVTMLTALATTLGESFDKQNIKVGARTIQRYDLQQIARFFSEQARIFQESRRSDLRTIRKFMAIENFIEAAMRESPSERRQALALLTTNGDFGNSISKILQFTEKPPLQPVPGGN